MESEKLGTCETQKWEHKIAPHWKSITCVGWREQPQGEATQCPTCGSADKAIQKWPCAERYRYRTGKADSWHGEAAEMPGLKLPTKDDPGDLAKFLPSNPAAQTEGGEKPEPDTDIELTTEQLGRIGQRISRMCEPSSPPATAAHNKYFVDRTPEGWGIFYTEPAAPETGRACIGGSKDEHIARLRCQILNSHLADVLEAVEFAKTQERLTERCQCVGEWKAGCPVHDAESSAPAGGAREWRLRMDLLGVSQHDFWDDMRAQGYAAEQVRQRDEAAESCVADLLTEVTQLRQERDALVAKVEGK